MVNSFLPTLRLSFFLSKYNEKGFISPKLVLPQKWFVLQESVVELYSGGRRALGPLIVPTLDKEVIHRLLLNRRVLKSLSPYRKKESEREKGKLY